SIEIKNINKYIEFEKQKFITKYGNPNMDVIPVSDLAFAQKLWTGSFGHVVLARHCATGELKTVKAVSVRMASTSPRNVNADRNVMAAMGTFPFTVRLECWAADAEWLYFIMPMVSIGTLFELVSEYGRLSENVVRFFSAQILLGVEFLHATGLVHRNLKPENVLVNVNGYVRLSGFGESKLIGRASRTYSLCGTPDYMPPEMVGFRGYGLAVDYWSLGIMLYEMAAARPPFIGPDVGVLFGRILRGEYRMDNMFSPPLQNLIQNLVQVSVTILK
ncbi:cAMP-dependent protein kinase catalytic subunit beta-like, partial [Aphis craccivora]